MIRYGTKLNGGKMTKIIYAYIVGDIIHQGHIIHLENAKALGDKLIVGVLTDEAVMQKKPRPIIPFSERMKLVKSLGCVDCVVAQDTYSPIKNIRTIKPDILAESTSHSKDDLKEIRKAAKQIDCRVVVLPYFPEQSSSSIKAKVIKQQKTQN